MIFQLFKKFSNVSSSIVLDHSTIPENWGESVEENKEVSVWERIVHLSFSTHILYVCRTSE